MQVAGALSTCQGIPSPGYDLAAPPSCSIRSLLPRSHLRLSLLPNSIHHSIYLRDILCQLSFGSNEDIDKTPIL